MARDRKSKLSLEDLYKFICSLKNGVGWSQAPNGKSLIRFLQEHYNYSSHQPMQQKVLELAQRGFLEQHFNGRTLFRVKPLKEVWEEEALNEITATTSPLAKRNGELATGSSKRFAIFFDYKNLESHLRNRDRFLDFSWLTGPLLKEGKIIFAFVFIPDHYANRVPLLLLANKHRFQPILCPREMGKSTTKDKDTVDAKMEDLGKALIEHSDITDVVIVSGDGDFQELTVFARWQQKSVRVISATEATSPRFTEMKDVGEINLQMI